MKKKLKICYIPYDGRELNNIAFSKKYDNRWTNILKKKLETEGHSIATYDINKIEHSDVILCFDNVYFQNNRHFMKIYNSKKLGDTIHIDYEPPSANCRIHNNSGLKLLSNLFKSLITYNDDVINGNTIIKGCIGDYLEKEREYKKDFKKRKLLCIIANYRADLIPFKRHKDELYTKRKEAVDYFQRKCPNEFDLYGSFWPKESQICLKGTLDRSKKMNTLSKYKFIISYDSIKNQRGYISEKIFDCFKAKIVPIYWGAENVTDYIPKECFIDKRDFETYDKLYEYLKSMTEVEYNNRILAIEKYLKSKKYNDLFSSEASAKIIYNQIMAPTREINYKLASSILNGFEKKRHSDQKYNSDNFYFETNFNNRITAFTTEKINKEHYLKFQLKASAKYKLEFIVKKDDNLIVLDSKVEKYNGAKNAVIWSFYMGYKDLIKHRLMYFYIKDKTTNEIKELNIDTDLYINEINCDGKSRMQARGNKLYLIMSIDYYRELIKKNKIAYKILRIPYVSIKKLIKAFK